MRPVSKSILVALAIVVLGGCRLHLGLVHENRAIELTQYEAIELGRDRRGDVMASLGPPDRVVYARTALIFDYLWKRHRGTDTRLFLPSEIIPGVDPLVVISVPRYFFDPAETPADFEPSVFDRLAQRMARVVNLVVPFANGQDLLIARGHQLRQDRVRIVFDRETLVAMGKSMRSAAGEYRDESLTDRILLRAD